MASVGTTVRVQVTFRDLPGTGAPVDPNTVTVEVVDTDTDPETTVATDTAARSGIGEYYYDWTPDQVGTFRVQFTGEFTDAPNELLYENFTVTETATSATLGQDYELLFATDATPLLIDPEEFVGHYPDANLVEIMGLVHRYSVEVREAFGGEALPLVAYDYIRAAVLCALSRTHGGPVGGGGEESVQLGDLSISYGSGGGSSAVTRGNARTPCEEAAALRREMVNAGMRSRTYVRGSKYRNPMPVRHIRSFPRRERERRGY